MPNKRYKYLEVDDSEPEELDREENESDEMENQEIITSGNNMDLEEPQIIKKSRTLKKDVVMSESNQDKEQVKHHLSFSPYPDNKKSHSLQKEKPLENNEYLQPTPNKEVLGSNKQVTQPYSELDILTIKRLELSILENQILLKQIENDTMKYPSFVFEDTKKEDSKVVGVNDRNVIEVKKEVIQEVPQLPVNILKKKKKGLSKRIFHKLTFNKFNSQDKLNFSPLNKNIIVHNSVYPDNNVHLTHEEYIGNLKNCPECNKKIIKSKVFQRHNSYVQIIKCKNKLCPFSKEIIFPIEVL